MLRADFRKGDEDSNFSILRVRRFSEWPEPLHWIAFPIQILTKPRIHWIASPLFTEKTFFSLESASSYPLPKTRLWNMLLNVPGWAGERVSSTGRQGVQSSWQWLLLLWHFSRRDPSASVLKRSSSTIFEGTAHLDPLLSADLGA